MTEKPDTTALIADDEPLLRERLSSMLQRVWPKLQIVAMARNGREAVELFEEHRPHVAFLDVHMPGMNGVEAARCMHQRTEIVFVTAHEHYAVEAFAQGAIDYVVKPIDEERLVDTVRRLQGKFLLLQRGKQASLAAASANSALLTPTAANVSEISTALPTELMLERLAHDLRERMQPRHYLQWIKASVGTTVRLIAVDQVLYLRSDTKYTLVVWEGGEALIRKTIREMADELDPQCFVQIHRSAIVNLNRVSQFSHGSNDVGEVQIKGRGDSLPVSRSFVHLFRQM